MRNKHGFTLIETLLALCCIGWAMALLVPCIQLIKTMQSEERRSDDRIAIHQLRLLFAQSSYQLQGNQVLLSRMEPETLYVDRGRVVRSPGYEIYIEAIQDARFEEENGCLHLYWRRSHEEKDAVLACK